MAIDTGTGLIIFSSILTVIVMFVCLFILGLNTKNPGPKIFFLSLSVLIILAIVGFNLSILQSDVSGFTNFIGSYSSFYVLLTYLTGAGGIGLILWLIYFGFTTFKKTKGYIEEDEE